MKLKSIAIASAVGSLLALGSVTAVADDAAKGEKEKCLGVAKAGQNDCASAAHACAGMAKADNLPAEWKFVPKGQCEKMGGKVAPASDKKAM